MTRLLTRGWTVSPLLTGCALVAGITSAATAWAAPVNVTSQRSVVVGDAHGTTFGEGSPYALAGPYISGAEAFVGGTHAYPGYPDFTTNEKAFAKQNSTVNPVAGIFAGTGDVGIGYSVVDADLAFARSSMEIWFDLATAHDYTLNGKLMAKMDGGLGLASVTLDGPTSFAYQKQGWQEGTLADGGTLAPGSYHLTISALIEPQCKPADCTAFSWMGGASSFDVSMQVTAVPEPATYGLWIVGLGLLGFLARRKGVVMA